MKRLGILGGNFDPVHLGHLRAAVELQESLQLDQVRMIPCARPPHRAPAVAGVDQRLQMLSLAVADDPVLVVDDSEVHLPGPSYTVNTLSKLRSEFPDSAIWLALGLDAFFYLHTWYQWQRLFDFASIVVLHRPGWQEDQVRQELNAGVKAELERRLVTDVEILSQARAGKIGFLQITGFDISSTRIRELVADGRSIRYLVPDSIAPLVNEIYRS